MSEMVERVAKAIAKCAPAIDQRAPYAKIMMLEAAKAAIKAMREPTEAMIEAGQEGELGRAESVEMIYTAMIDAALAPPEQPGGAP
jgi:hypothetical protein